MNKDSKIYVAGHRGMVGSAIVRRLEELGYTNIVAAPRNKLNLLDQSEVDNFFTKQKPEYHIFGQQMTKEQWDETKRDFNGIPPSKDSRYEQSM